MKTKKSKRIISLILALTMVFTFMAMSASAATTEIQPRGTCPQCINGYVTSTIEMVGKYTDYKRISVGYNQCSYMTMPHSHYNVKYEVRAICRNCSYNEVTYSYQQEFCPYSE